MNIKDAVASNALVAQKMRSLNATTNTEPANNMGIYQ